MIENAFDEGADYASTTWVAEADAQDEPLVGFDLPYAQPVTRLELREAGSFPIDSIDVWVCGGFEFNEVNCIEVASNQQADSGIGIYEIITFGEAVYGNSVWLNDFVKKSNLMSVGISDVRIFADTCYDNCPNEANPDQADTNENGIGDACE